MEGLTAMSSGLQTSVSEATHAAHFYGEVEGHVDYVAGYLATHCCPGPER